MEGIVVLLLEKFTNEIAALFLTVYRGLGRCQLDIGRHFLDFTSYSIQRQTQILGKSWILVEQIFAFHC